MALFGEENRKMGKEYDNFGHFTQIECHFLEQQLFSSPFLQISGGEEGANLAGILTSGPLPSTN